MVAIRYFIVKLADSLNRASGVVAGICILAIATFVTYEVVLRFVFNAPTEWVNEVSVYLGLISAFLGFAPALASGKHISVDLVISKLSPETNKVLKLLVSLLGLLFSIVFLITSLEMTLNAYRLNMLSVSTLRIPLFIPQMALPIGFALLSIQFVANLLTLDQVPAEKEHGR